MRIKWSFDKILLFSYFGLLAGTGTVLLLLPFSVTQPLSVPDALFTSVSAVCVTGLCTVPMSTFTVFGKVVILFLIQFGGLGIITFFSLYIGIGSRRRVSFMNRKMIRSFFIDEVESDHKKIVRNIVSITLGIELAGAVCLYGAFSAAGVPNPAFTAVFHAVSSFCNAGFSTFNDSLAGFADNPAVLVPIAVLIFLGGIGFIVMKDVFRFVKTFGRERVSYHAKLALGMTAFLIAGGTVLFLILEWNQGFAQYGAGGKILSAFFQSVTTRTAGFESVAQAQFSPVSGFVTLLLMFIGGSPGSIAGGVKTTTFLIVMAYALNERDDSTSMLLGRKSISAGILEKAFNIISKSIIFLCIAVFLLMCTEERLLLAGTASVFDVLFESFSAFGTVGLTRGLTPHLSDLGKIVIIATMFIGRTGVFAMILKIPGKKEERLIRYPDEQVMLG